MTDEFEVSPYSCSCDFIRCKLGTTLHFTLVYRVQTSVNRITQSNVILQRERRHFVRTLTKSGHALITDQRSLITGLATNTGCMFVTPSLH